MSRLKSSSKEWTQAEKAYEAIKRAILRGEIPQGVFLSEAEITRQYGIGRTPYREACNRLHHDRLLEAVTRRGYLVPEISFHAARGLFEAWLVLEGAIAELAALRAGESQIEVLDRMARHPLPDAGSARDFEEHIAPHKKFHVQLAQMARNRPPAEMLTSVPDWTERLMHFDPRNSHLRKREWQTLHAPISVAVRGRRPVAAREAVLRDIRQEQRFLFGIADWQPANSAARAWLHDDI